jgi:hypothetical protein
MIAMSKSLVARAALGFVALAGVVAAAPASARDYENHGGWGHDRGRIERSYERGYDRGHDRDYHREWRPERGYAPMMVWHGHDDRR